MSSSFTDVTARELRFTYQGSLNLAMGERWVLRGYGGVAAEQPTFHARFFGLTVEYDLLPQLSVSLTGRYYHDTGELENSLLLSSGAPPLESWEFGLGLRYGWRSSSIRLYAGPFWTNYTRHGDASAEFTYLYTDRNWALAQVTYSRQF